MLPEGRVAQGENDRLVKVDGLGARLGLVWRGLKTLVSTALLSVPLVPLLVEQ